MKSFYFGFTNLFSRLALISLFFALQLKGEPDLKTSVKMAMDCKALPSGDIQDFVEKTLSALSDSDPHELAVVAHKRSLRERGQAILPQHC